MNRLQSFFALFVICICSYADADDNINMRITTIYEALSEKGVFSEEDYKFLNYIPEITLINSPDSK